MDLDSGIYNLIIYLDKAKELQIGSLGEFHFQSGYYIYTGTAQRALRARIARHKSKDKKLHWHIDYLLQVAEVVKVLVWPGDKKAECRLHKQLAIQEELAVPVLGFGASDCNCKSHLLYSAQLPKIDQDYYIQMINDKG
ncbi:GIY-YIG nuclease family protein [Fuchsiella alkaliacetigena]|uniref:GIY-YIG nuclease family protein n=1 Tax=Fuchsiella alkaliacetigena TaxID=957042 RepID=UPI00200B863D|nr:GIY-YIG nuclease family protein [Fuchsiella alkaliacetigena]MCK8824064.1 GIY-YIG nuclease family protein [Fuchsiella alkaliacetigena]